MIHTAANQTTSSDYGQLQYEKNCWKRSLSFMMEENIHLKTRLAQILQRDVDKQLLERAENFQNRFIKIDEFMRLIRDDIASLEKPGLLPTAVLPDISTYIKRKVKKIRANLNRLESFMTRIKFQFNSQLLQKG